MLCRKLYHDRLFPQWNERLYRIVRSGSKTSPVHAAVLKTRLPDASSGFSVGDRRETADLFVYLLYTLDPIQTAIRLFCMYEKDACIHEAVTQELISAAKQLGMAEQLQACIAELSQTHAAPKQPYRGEPLRLENVPPVEGDTLIVRTEDAIMKEHGCVFFALFPHLAPSCLKNGSMFMGACSKKVYERIRLLIYDADLPCEPEHLRDTLEAYVWLVSLDIADSRLDDSWIRDRVVNYVQGLPHSLPHTVPDLPEKQCVSGRYGFTKDNWHDEVLNDDRLRVDPSDLSYFMGCPYRADFRQILHTTESPGTWRNARVWHPLFPAALRPHLMQIYRSAEKAPLPNADLYAIAQACRQSMEWYDDAAFGYWLVALKACPSLMSRGEIYMQVKDGIERHVIMCPEDAAHLVDLAYTKDFPGAIRIMSSKVPMSRPVIFVEAVHLVLQQNSLTNERLLRDLMVNHKNLPTGWEEAPILWLPHLWAKRAVSHACDIRQAVMEITTKGIHKCNRERVSMAAHILRHALGSPFWYVARDHKDTRIVEYRRTNDRASTKATCCIYGSTVLFFPTKRGKQPILLTELVENSGSYKNHEDLEQLAMDSLLKVNLDGDLAHMVNRLKKVT